MCFLYLSIRKNKTFGKYWLFLQKKMNGYHLDKNECATNNGGCNHKCINQEKTYRCECYTGYFLGKDNHSCIGELKIYSFIYFRFQISKLCFLLKLILIFSCIRASCRKKSLHHFVSAFLLALK